MIRCRLFRCSPKIALYFITIWLLLLLSWIIVATRLLLLLLLLFSTLHFAGQLRMTLLRLGDYRYDLFIVFASSRFIFGHQRKKFAQTFANARLNFLKNRKEIPQISKKSLKLKKEKNSIKKKQTCPSRPILTGLFSFHGFSKCCVLVNKSSCLMKNKGKKKILMFFHCVNCFSFSFFNFISLLCDPIDFEYAQKRFGAQRGRQNPVDLDRRILTTLAGETSESLEAAALGHRKYENDVGTLLECFVQLGLVESWRRPNILKIINLDL